MNNTTKLSETAKKYKEIITSGTIEERQIIDMRSFMNKSKENATFIFSIIQGKQLSLTPQQSEKGHEFLLSKWQTPRGIERKNNPFGYREQEILKNFDRIELESLYNNGNAYIDNYLPLYEVISKDGSSFEYYYDGKINIVG